MVSAVFWDFGGVLTTSPFEAFNRYEKERGLPRDFIRSINARNPDDNAWARFERSEISADEFDHQFASEAAAAGHEVPGRDVIALLAGDLRPAMVAALRRCGEHFATACLTNNVRAGEGPGMQLEKSRAAEIEQVMAMFDLVIESSRIGVRKPDPRFYELGCEKMQVSPDEVVYLDDLGVNLKPARAMGMRTIKVVDPAAALAELQDALGIDLNDPAAQ